MTLHIGNRREFPHSHCIINPFGIPSTWWITQKKNHKNRPEKNKRPKTFFYAFHPTDKYSAQIQRQLHFECKNIQLTFTFTVSLRLTRNHLLSLCRPTSVVWMTFIQQRGSLQFDATLEWNCHRSKNRKNTTKMFLIHIFTFNYSHIFNWKPRTTYRHI